MKYLQRGGLLFLLSFVLFSCGQKSKELNSKETTRLPNFGSVKLEEVFKNTDNRIDGEGELEQLITQYYDRVWEKGDLWGGFLIAKGDKILFERYRGYAQDNEESKIDPGTALHVASVSKSLTAMTTLKLVEAGKLSLDQEVASLFPKFPYQGITVRMLLNQRSGLPKYEYFIERIDQSSPQLAKKFLTNQDVLDLLIDHKPDLARKPDTGFMYCNTNYALLALIIEKVTSTPFPQAMKQMVFTPLEMEDSYIFQEKDTLSAAKSFFARGPSVHPYDRLDLIYGDKNLYTTPRDLFNFSRAMYSEDFLKKELMEQVFIPYSQERPGVNNYGLGFRMKVFDENSKLTYHNGWWHGSNSVFAHLLQSKVTIIAIGNKYSQRVYSALALSALFENFPYEREKLNKELGSSADSLQKTVEVRASVK